MFIWLSANYNTETLIYKAKSFKDQYLGPLITIPYSTKIQIPLGRPVINPFLLKKYFLLENIEFTKHSWKRIYAKLILSKTEQTSIFSSNIIWISKNKN